MKMKKKRNKNKQEGKKRGIKNKKLNAEYIIFQNGRRKIEYEKQEERKKKGSQKTRKTIKNQEKNIKLERVEEKDANKEI